MGLKYLSASPEPGSFDILDKLVEEYDVAIGIHNHGPGDRLSTKIAKPSRRPSRTITPKIGCCSSSTGHFLRSRGRTRSMRSRPLASGSTASTSRTSRTRRSFTVLGPWRPLCTVDLLKALARKQYDYCLAIEYEENPENALDDIKACLAETTTGPSPR